MVTESFKKGQFFFFYFVAKEFEVRAALFSHNISSHTSIVYFSSYLEQKTLAPLRCMCVNNKKVKTDF